MKNISTTLLAIALATSAVTANLSDAEIPYDVNGDDRLDEEERQAMVALQDTISPTTNSRTRSRSAPSIRQQIQANIDQRRSDRFLAADTNGDEQLSFQEFTTIPAATRLGETKATSIFTRLDQNKNNLITQTEFTTTLTEIKNQ